MIVMIFCTLLFFALLPANFLLALIPLCIMLLVAVEKEKER